MAKLNKVTASGAPRGRDGLFRIQYQNQEAKDWTDFYPLKLFTGENSGHILYRCRHRMRTFIAKAAISFGDDYVDLVTDKEESVRLDIYPGTVRVFFKKRNGSVNISEIHWADPGKKFELLQPSPLVDFLKMDALEKQREVDRLDRLAKHRPEQAKFRSELLSIYNGACAVTNCSVSETLQAAHLETLEGKDMNDPCNGILLRADIHELFDAGLFTLSEDGLRVETSELLTDVYYLGFQGAPVFRPSLSPSRKHINAHRRASGFNVSPRKRKRRS